MNMLGVRDIQKIIACIENLQSQWSERSSAADLALLKDLQLLKAELQKCLQNKDTKCSPEIIVKIDTVVQSLADNAKERLLGALPS